MDFQFKHIFHLIICKTPSLQQRLGLHIHLCNLIHLLNLVLFSLWYHFNRRLWVVKIHEIYYLCFLIHSLSFNSFLHRNLKSFYVKFFCLIKFELLNLIHEVESELLFWNEDLFKISAMEACLLELMEMDQWELHSCLTNFYGMFYV